MHKIESIAKIPKISINYKHAKVPKISLEISKSTFTHAIGKKEKKIQFDLRLPKICMNLRLPQNKRIR
jgi:hypothetical protein